MAHSSLGFSKTLEIASQFFLFIFMHITINPKSQNHSLKVGRMYPQIKTHLATNKMETRECFKWILSQIKRKKKHIK